MPEMLPELFDSEYFLWAEAKAGVFFLISLDTFLLHYLKQ